MQPNDPAAWDELVARYGQHIYAWCRQGKLQDADAQDVTQMVLVRLVTRMGTFHYDPTRSFRGWLRTLTRHAWSDYLAARQRPGQGTGDSLAREWLEKVEARESLVASLEGQFDQEILAEAMARVRLRVDDDTWEAFRLMALEGRPGAEVARQLDKTVAAAFKAKSRVQKLLREETARLEGND
jgi:RNA polymerase sigma-70 factor (ECF subfamily)